MARIDFALRPLEATDLEAAHRLSLAISWPHRLEDWRLFHALGTGLVACDAAGAVIGTAMWWAYGMHAGTLGMVLVAPSQQGGGIGRALMEAVLKDAGPRALMLNATEAGLRPYESLGFRTVGRIRQHQGEYRATPIATHARSARVEDRAALEALDTAAFGAARTALLDRLLQSGLAMVLETDQGIRGFAIRHRFGRGQAIGPVVAGNETDAIALIAALAEPGFLRVDIPAEAAQLAARLTAAGLAPVDTPTVMVRGTWPACAPDFHRFGLVSQALG
jgi:predicted N-acetyltransferase YhbS